MAKPIAEVRTLGTEYVEEMQRMYRWLTALGVQSEEAKRWSVYYVDRLRQAGREYEYDIKRSILTRAPHARHRGKASADTYDRLTSR